MLLIGLVPWAPWNASFALSITLQAQIIILLSDYGITVDGYAKVEITINIERQIGTFPSLSLW